MKVSVSSFIILCAVLFYLPTYADPNGANQECINQERINQDCIKQDCPEQNCPEGQEEYPLRLPGERAWSYDEELEAPVSYPGKREDAFYDWLTK